MKGLINAVWNMNGPDNQLTILEEECTEVLKEICKIRRGKGDERHLCEECVDAINSALAMLYGHGMTEDQIKLTMEQKYIRALTRNAETGEI